MSESEMWEPGFQEPDGEPTTWADTSHGYVSDTNSESGSFSGGSFTTDFEETEWTWFAEGHETDSSRNDGDEPSSSSRDCELTQTRVKMEKTHTHLLANDKDRLKDREPAMDLAEVLGLIRMVGNLPPRPARTYGAIPSALFSESAAHRGKGKPKIPFGQPGNLAKHDIWKLSGGKHSVLTEPVPPELLNPGERNLTLARRPGKLRRLGCPDLR